MGGSGRQRQSHLLTVCYLHISHYSLLQVSHTTISQVSPPVQGIKSNMRTRQRPVSQQSAKPQTRSAATRPARKIFNCIVDDSALVAGVKRSTRNGIRQWVKNGQIRLFVPLHGE